MPRDTLGPMGGVDGGYCGAHVGLDEENFNGDGAVVFYLNNVRTTKETDVVQIVNDAQGADDMIDHDEWISYSHWGMFTLGRKSSN